MKRLPFRIVRVMLITLNITASLPPPSSFEEYSVNPTSSSHVPPLSPFKHTVAATGRRRRLKLIWRLTRRNLSRYTQTNYFLWMWFDDLEFRFAFAVACRTLEIRPIVSPSIRLRSSSSRVCGWFVCVVFELIPGLRRWRRVTAAVGNGSGATRIRTFPSLHLFYCVCAKLRWRRGWDFSVLHSCAVRLLHRPGTRILLCFWKILLCNPTISPISLQNLKNSHFIFNWF